MPARNQNPEQMNNNEVEKSTVFNIGELVDSGGHAMATRTIINRNTGKIVVLALDSNEVLKERISPFDTFIHVISGSAEIRINEEHNILEPGQCIIVPAHASNSLRVISRCKLISTVIKSGYEDYKSDSID